MQKTWQPAPVFLSGKFYGQRSLAGYSPWSCRESEHNVRKSFLFSPVLKYGLMDFCFIQCIESITVIIYFNASDCFRIVQWSLCARLCALLTYYQVFFFISIFLFSETARCSHSVQLSHVRLFVTPWTAACQASLSITNSRSPPKPMSIELVMPSNHLILCHPPTFSSHLQSFPASESFQITQFFASGGQSIGVSASASVLPMNTQD